MVLSVAHDASGATVAIATASGATDVHIDAVPDPEGAERAMQTNWLKGAERLSRVIATLGERGSW